MVSSKKKVATKKTSPSLAIAKKKSRGNKDVVLVEAPIVSSYNDRIRPLLDTVDRLRNLNVMREGIHLPTIVVVGDQSSGKSSVLESLAGISLPRGQGICTRVPLVMRLQRSSSPEPEIWLEYSDKVVPTDEEHIAEAIRAATDVIAGSGKGVSDAPLTLHVKKAGVPDLTMVDLPGITRVPVNGQPENIYEQISGMIMEYIEPQESIILNVLSATVDFTTCESIRMSRKVDKTGQRTLAVVTKADMAPEGLLQKVTADDVSIVLGYVCVRNRIGEETYEEARMQEELLFKTHPVLSLIDEDIVGIPVLAQKLMLIQASMIARCLPNIVRKINQKLDTAVLELNKLPMVMASTGEALMALMNIIGSAKESLLRILVQGDFSEYPDDQNMHCTARLADMLSQFSDNLQAKPKDVSEFLMDEIKILDECKCVGLPNFIPRSAFLAILSQHVDGIQDKPVEFINKIWDYVEVVLSSVISKHSDNFPQIQSSIKRAGRNLISKIKEQSVNRVMEIVEMEKLTDYTCSPEYMTSWTQKTGEQESFMYDVLKNGNKPDYFSMNGFGNVKISHLRKYHAHLLIPAFDMKMRITSYWNIVLRRIVDNLALYLQLSVKSLVNSQFQKEIVAEMVDPRDGRGVEKMLEESPLVASKREKLKNSIKLLKESKDAVAAIVDQNC
ncbi:Dynamin-type guanine nucleotide-binding (G) domain [Arabidopsis thaliana x Arabidopsis arenosa]|uniref:Dynamin-type guanine nucleotide-binding (G) domain n=1 Tax=Arabidopsis thaliana x Arabidopsis arenosa TaxID=1240361 RepID=A0A8T2BGP3_9BRAS|nr:Dynamin-type guanine nucleotide-binding (G) domain [Arabidopsis thaliana x Arabidopsis arenosa]